MSSHRRGQDKRQYPRLPHDAHGTLFLRKAKDDHEALAVTVCSVSPEGLGLALREGATELPAVGHVVTVRFAVLERDIALPAQVRWVRRAGNGGALGLRLLLEITPEAVRQFYAEWIVSRIGRERRDVARGAMSPLMPAPQRSRRALNRSRPAPAPAIGTPRPPAYAQVAKPPVQPAPNASTRPAQRPVQQPDSRPDRHLQRPSRRLRPPSAETPPLTLRAPIIPTLPATRKHAPPGDAHARYSLPSRPARRPRRTSLPHTRYSVVPRHRRRPRTTSDLPR